MPRNHRIDSMREILREERSRAAYLYRISRDEELSTWLGIERSTEPMWQAEAAFVSEGDDVGLKTKSAESLLNDQSEKYLRLGVSFLTYLLKAVKEAGLEIPEWMNIGKMFGKWLMGSKNFWCGRYETLDYKLVDEFLDAEWSNIVKQIKDGPPPKVEEIPFDPLKAKNPEGGVSTTYFHTLGT